MKVTAKLIQVLAENIPPPVFASELWKRTKFTRCSGFLFVCIIEFDCSGVRLKLCSPCFVIDGLVFRSNGSRVCFVLVCWLVL